MGQTKVTGWDGRPQKVYHGTKYDFAHFENEYAGRTGTFGPGHYFTEEPGIAEHYAQEGSVKGAYLDIQNPFMLNGQVKEDLLEDLVIMYEQKGLEVPMYLNRVKTNMPIFQGIQDFFAAQNPISGDKTVENPQGEKIKLKDQVIQALSFDYLQDQGFDGLHIEDVWVAFDAKQIYQSLEDLEQKQGRPNLAADGVRAIEDIEKPELDLGIDQALDATHQITDTYKRSR